MIALIIGHSYVRDLKSHSESLIANKLALVNGGCIELKFICVNCATFNSFFRSPSVLSLMLEIKPDIICVILGGNDFKGGIELSAIKNTCIDFYAKIKSIFPGAIIVASQVEKRFVEAGDRYSRFGVPPPELFKKLSVYFNSWINKQKFKDRILCIRGKSKLDDIKFYRDSVHLNNQGIAKYFDILSSLLVDIVSNQ